MQLWYAPTSPFARKVRIAAAELGIALDLVEVDPWSDERLRALNPIAKVPTLVRDDGSVLIESGLICRYLDSLAGNHLFPPAGEPLWAEEAVHAIADGVSTATGRLFAEERKPEPLRSAFMLERFETAVTAGLLALDEKAQSFDPQNPMIGQIATAVALGYLAFRWPDRDWLSASPRLAEWFETFALRPSMRSTAHRLPSA